MKRMHVQPIKASTDENDIENIFNGAFSDIGFSAYKIDYEMTVDSNLNMTIKCIKDEKFMPEITVKMVEEEGVYYYTPDVKFPELKYDDMDFADSVHYWVATKWADVAEFITALNKFSYDPQKWEE